MWIMLNNAFISVVADRDNPGNLLVRARDQGHIEKALGISPKVVKKTIDADYLFRVSVPASVVSTALVTQVNLITYRNFKNSVKDDDLHDAYMDVWTVMYRHQHRQESKRRFKARPAAPAKAVGRLRPNADGLAFDDRTGKIVNVDTVKKGRVQNLKPKAK